MKFYQAIYLSSKKKEPQEWGPRTPIFTPKSISLL